MLRETTTRLHDPSKKLGLPNLLRKTDYHVLAGLVARDKLAAEITAKLDAILAVAKSARPSGE